MAQPDFYFNPFDADFRANPYPHFPALLDGPPRQLNLFMPTTLVARYADVITRPARPRTLHRSPPGDSVPRANRSVRRRAHYPHRGSAGAFPAAASWSARPSLHGGCASSSRESVRLQTTC